MTLGAGAQPGEAPRATTARPVLEPVRAAAPPAPPAPAARASEPWLLRLYPALAVPGFRLMWLGLMPATLAWQMGVVAMGYAAFLLTDSATVLGIVNLASGLPMLVLGLVGGVVADRVSRRNVLLATQSALGLGSLFTALLAISGRLEVWHLVALGGLQGVTLAFNMPARQALAAELAGRRLVRSAMALQNAGMNLSRVVGPALGGALLASPLVGVGGVFLANAALYGAVLVSLLRLPGGTAPARRAGGNVANGWSDMVAGLRYIATTPTLGTLLLLAFLPLVLGMHYLTLMPLFAERVFGVGAVGLGMLMGVTGLGALVGSVVAAGLTSYRQPAWLLAGFGAVFGLSLVVFALAPAFAVALAALAVTGFMGSAYGAITSGLIVAASSPALHGRVMSVYMLTFAMMPVASVPAAWLADRIGGPATVAGSGVLVAVVVIGAILLSPAARRIR